MRSGKLVGEGRVAGGAVAFLLKGYPRLSETFIAHEIRSLEERGLDIRIVSLRRPTDRMRHPVHAEIRAPVAYLPEYLYREPWRVLRAWLAMRRHDRYREARRRWLADLRRDPTPNRVRRFGQALVLAHELDPDVTALHAHFLHTPASVARYASLLTGLPWSVSAHARDIWTTPDWEKREKLVEANWAVTCTRTNRDHLAALAPAGRVALAYHGIDPARFPPWDGPRAPRDGGDLRDPVKLLSVGRLVEKKGTDVLLGALARLPAGLAWELDLVGGGPLEARLEREARRLGLAARIRWHGALPQHEVLRCYRTADLFVLASRVAGDGDRDGLPNVLLEAQSQGLAVVSTALSAIPELVEQGVTGLLVPAGDEAALAAALTVLIVDPAQRARLGRAGLERVVSHFATTQGLDLLTQRFGLAEGVAGTDRGAA